MQKFHKRDVVAIILTNMIVILFSALAYNWEDHLFYKDIVTASVLPIMTILCSMSILLISDLYYRNKENEFNHTLSIVINSLRFVANNVFFSNDIETHLNEIKQSRKIVELLHHNNRVSNDLVVKFMEATDIDGQDNDRSHIGIAAYKGFSLLMNYHYGK